MNDINDTVVTSGEEPKKFNPMLLPGVVLVIAIVGIGFVMSQGNSNQNSTATIENTDTTQISSSPLAMVESSPAVDAAMDGIKTEGDIRIITLEAGAFYYKPNEIKVKKGETVRIEMKSADMMHDFNIDELNVDMDIVKSGDTGTVEFTVDKAGTFEFYCSVGEHRKNGQIGTLIVTE